MKRSQPPVPRAPPPSPSSSLHPRSPPDPKQADKRSHHDYRLSPTDPSIPISPLQTYRESVTYGCGHTDVIPIMIFGRATDTELVAARNRAAAGYRYRVCWECEEDDDDGASDITLLAEAIGTGLELLSAEFQRRLASPHYYYYELGEVLCRIVALRWAAGGIIDDTVVMGMAEDLMDRWVRLAVAALEPGERGRLLFTVRMEMEGEEVEEEEALQWVAERLARVGNSCGSASDAKTVLHVCE